MISPDARTVTITRHEFRIPSPATQRDVADTLTQARDHMANSGADATFDDSVLVEAQDDELVFYWTEEKRD